MTYLPSRKIVFLIIIILFIFAGGFWFFKNKSATIGNTSVKDIFADNLEKIAEKLNGLDSSNDGLKDWEEVLQNVQQNSGFDNLGSSDSVNLTKELAKSMAAQAVSLKEGEYPDISDSIKSIDKNTNRSMLEFIASFNTQISEKELIVSGDNSPEAVKRYYFDVSKAIPQNPYPQKTEDEIFTEAMSTKNFRLVDNYIKHYEQAIENMKKVVAPSDFLAIHKKEIELFMATKKVYESIKEIDKDPLKTVIAIQQYEKIRKETSELTVSFLGLVQKHSE